MSTSQSLRQTEAVARRALLDVTSYEIELDLTGSEETFTSRTTLRFDSRGGDTFVDLKPLALQRAELNGQPLPLDSLGAGRLPITSAVGANELVVDATMPFRNDGEGLHRSIDPADGRAYVYGMNFMEAAPTVYACFDQPDLKAPYTFTVRVPEDWTVVGNAPATSPEQGVWRIGPTQPLSTYFVTIVAGPYHRIHDTHDGIPLGLSARQSLASALEADAEDLLTVTKQCFDEFHRLFGIRYPFGDYHQCFVPEFNAGAMENPGCVTIRDTLVFDTRAARGRRIFRAALVAHEMAHQWFGNTITPVWWDDLWLNESFAEYLGYRVTADVTEYSDAWSTVSWQRRQWGLRADMRSTTHPVAGNGAADAASALENFDGISYAKGSSILRQLATTMGDDTFFGGVSNLMDQRRFGNATMHDVFQAWTDAGAQGLDGVIEQWLRTAGADVLRIDRETGTLHRTPPPNHPADRSHRFDVQLLGDDTRVESVVVQGDTTPLEVGSAAYVLDPYEQSWGVYVPDSSTMSQLLVLLPHVQDAQVLAGIWNNVKSGYSLAEVDPDAVIDLVAARFPLDDTEDGPRSTLRWLLSEVVPVASDGALARVHDAAALALGAQAPGSDEQLVALRAAIATATDAGVLERWRADPPGGITVDRDLTWRFLTQLAALDAVGRDELDAALADDPASASQLGHVAAVSSLPDAEAKEFAWARFTGAAEASNYEIEAAGLAMWRGTQIGLTEPYVDRYLAELPRLGETRSGWLLASSAEAFFPHPHADHDVVARVEELVGSGALPSPVARRVSDQASIMRARLDVATAYPPKD